MIYNENFQLDKVADTASLKGEGEKHELCSQNARKNERARS